MSKYLTTVLLYHLFSFNDALIHPLGSKKISNISISRRTLLTIPPVALLTTSLRSPVLADGIPTRLSSALSERLRSVPFFAITTADGEQPYFTLSTKNGAPLAIFFSERADAEAALPKDPAAIVTSVSLEQAWSLVNDPNEKDNGGLFQLQSSRRQIVHANGNGGGKDLKLDVDGRVPLFFDRRVTLNDSDTFPLFLKLEDLERIYQKGIAGMSPEGRQVAGPVKVSVTTVDRAVAGLQDGSLGVAADKVIFVSSESF